jgi:hypothetical protein
MFVVGDDKHEHGDNGNAPMWHRGRRSDLEGYYHCGKFPRSASNPDAPQPFSSILQFVGEQYRKEINGNQ